MPTYTSPIPQPGDVPAQSQNQILENFEVLATAFAQDHGAYNSATEGEHNQITFPTGPLAGQPFTYLAGQIGLQSLNQAPTARPDIWLSRGVAAPYPMTGFDNGAVSANNAVAWSYLPSGMKRIGGKATTTAGTITITLNSTAAGGLNTFPGFSNFISDISALTLDASATATIFMRVVSFTLTTITFSCSNTGSNSTFFWSATGM